MSATPITAKPVTAKPTTANLPVAPIQRLLRDPRHFQIAVLSSLLAWGVVGLGLEVRPAAGVVILAAALATQWAGTRWVRWKTGIDLRFEPRSVMISVLSLTLLLRTGSLAVAALAAFLTIGSKFVVRWRGKHVFNPTNFGLAAILLATDNAWVSPGQWGSAAAAAFAVACLGFVVVRRAARSDVTWAFLVFYGGLVFGRALWLGDPLAIPLHHLSSGAFLIFAFFMISDPRTTPDSRAGRLLFAALVAAGAGYVHFVLFQPNGLIWSLAALAPLVPLIDLLLPGRRYHWPARARAALSRVLPVTAVEPASLERSAP
ncbi:MAG TPA: RnfABCDGE type electron transport complex subunit D [Thermoanaerobaculia bacterium]|nr:RnfABCDGE type electron transport complex subunit D [Thermoanaerobaculia bacterium]